MPHNHLETVLLKDEVIKEQVKELKNSFGVDVHYFWDEEKLPHFGEGWICEYIILGLTFGTGIAVKELIQAPFKHLGQVGFKAICDLFRLTAARFKREKSFFFVNNVVKGRTLTIFMDNAKLSDSNFIVASLQILEKLSFLIETGDEFTTEYYEGSLLIMYDSRCEDIMIFPHRFDIEHENASMLTTSYGWAMWDKPDAKKDETFRLDNLFLIRAIFHRSLHEYATAISFFNKATKENINNMDAHMELGNTFYNRGKYQEAVDAWLRALDVTAESVRLPKIYFNLGCGMVKLNNMKRAVRMFEKALESGLNGELIKSDPDLSQFRRSEHYGQLLKLLD